MQHDVTATITEAFEAGITWDELDERFNARHTTITRIGREYVVHNRSDEALIEREIPALIAHKLLDPATGTFAKSGREWGVRVPAADYREGRAVVIAKRDGTRKDATLGVVMETRGDYIIASFTEGFPPVEAPAETAAVEAETPATVETVGTPATTTRRRRRGYTVVHSPVYGRGIRYDDLPGATHYGSAQIWDNA